MSLTLKIIKQLINETESVVPANAMGTSSSVAGTGGIDTFDPLLQFKKKKSKESNGRRRTIKTTE